ncbi:sulfatase-like hydrolase/transferase [candidate division KSB1 bacterium]|nr:sulfatase-like hydrolase/transferase [candidate division KSB1 bacterium]
MHTDRRTFLKTSGTAAAALSFSNLWSAIQDSKERPNILWLTSEDNSPFLGCYGDPNAITPNLDKLASEGIVFDHCYANAPVCAPARSTIITGMYATSLGTHHMRSYNPIPKHIKFFTNYLRDAGYYCTNTSKEDYNVAEKPDGCWDESSRTATYKNREPNQPFFAIFNHTVSHESSLHRIESLTHDPDKMRLSKYHPDHPEIRRDYAQYYDKITELDRQIGDKLKQLEDAGLAGNTIVFYYADHGGILTRSKRFLYDSGTHVPLIVRFPKKWQHLAPAMPGSRTGRLVSFVDLAPTVLSLAGVPIPDHMQGNAFLGQKRTENPDYAYMFRGRMDERYDMMRAVTNGRYRYIRNFMPHLIYGQHLNYLWRMRTTQVWEQLYLDGKCEGPQKFFWEPKPMEELYDTQDDPDEVVNLAENPQYTEILDRMRTALYDWMLEIHDPGLLPEAEMLDRAGDQTVFKMAQDPKRNNQKQLLEAADVANQRDPDNLSLLIAMMDDEDSAVRYWATIGCLTLGKEARPAFNILKEKLDDPAPNVRIAAAEILARWDNPEKPLQVLKAALDHENARAQLHAANALDNLGEIARPLLDDFWRKYKEDSQFVSRVMKYKLESWGELEPPETFPKISGS